MSKQDREFIRNTVLRIWVITSIIVMVFAGVASIFIPTHH